MAKPPSGETSIDDGTVVGKTMCWMPGVAGSASTQVCVGRWNRQIVWTPRPLTRISAYSSFGVNPAVTAIENPQPDVPGTTDVITGCMYEPLAASVSTMMSD